MSSLKTEETQEQWQGQKVCSMAECKRQVLVGVVGATEDHWSHFASAAEWGARAASEQRRETLGLGFRKSLSGGKECLVLAFKNCSSSK